MIFKTAEQIEPQGPWANGTSDHLGAAARRALDTHLADLYEPVTREWLGKHLPASGISRGLHLASGSGENTFLLAALLGSKRPSWASTRIRCWWNTPARPKP